MPQCNQKLDNGSIFYENCTKLKRCKTWLWSVYVTLTLAMHVCLKDLSQIFATVRFKLYVTHNICFGNCKIKEISNRSKHVVNAKN